MEKKKENRISKFLSLMLRHQPEIAGITLDNEGWTEVNPLISKLNEKYGAFTLEDLQDIVATNSKQRFAFNEDQKKIRANQGHSIEVDLNLSSKLPPNHLYHGTAEKHLGLIHASGLKKMNRTHVHLSADMETAAQVGKRHGKLYIFKVEAQRMAEDGYDFFLSNNGVWLTDHVPVDYLSDINGVCGGESI